MSGFSKVSNIEHRRFPLLSYFVRSGGCPALSQQGQTAALGGKGP
jgi:hypothetical protein